MEQLVILVIIGLISLVNWLMQRSAEIKKQRRLEQQGHDLPRESEEVPEAVAPRRAAPDRDPTVEMRRLMEALGIPMEEEPPALPEPPRAMPDPPAPTPAPIQQAPPKPAQLPAQPPSAPAASTAAVRAGLAQALRSREGLREAVILREILGPPKAMTL